jgi:hypothetical protein
VFARVALGLVRRWSPWQLDLPEGGASWLPLAWCLQVLGYLVLGIGCLALGLAFGLLRPELVLPVAAGLCFAGLAGIAAFFVPAGLGVREAALAWFLAPWLGAAPALLLAVLARLWISMGEATVIAGGLLWLRGKTDSPKPAEPEA